MSFFNLDDTPILAASGVTLNTEERATLASSLVCLRDAENFHTVALWGKILGIQKDYLIAQALKGDDLFNKKWFYSFDAISWLQLGEVSSEELALASKVQNRFLGDPSFEYPVALDDGIQRAISEEKRLACTIQLIDKDVAVVPRGAYHKDPTGKLAINPVFTGISPAEIGRLESYLHFNKNGLNVNAKTIAEKESNFDENVDILESIAKDEPKGVWSLKMERQGSVAFLRSLLWPGYVFFHAPAGNGPHHPYYSSAAQNAAPLNMSNIGGAGAGNKFGAYYCGTGQKAVNIGFML